MADEDGFDSSELEFDAPAFTKEAAYRGQASIDLIIENSAADRIASKKTIKQLQFGHGAPGTRRKVKPRESGKPAPNDELVTNAFKVLLAYGEFQWDEKDGFKISRRDGRHLQTFIDDATKAGRLIKGRWNKRTWIGFVTLSRMVRTFLEHWATHGCLSWDVVIQKCLSVVLVAAIGCRSGDVAHAEGWQGCEYMQWRHIDLYFDGHIEYRNLRAQITVENGKGEKDTMNEESTVYFRPLEDSFHMCVIALLLTHGLRNGLLLGSTIEEVFEHAASTPGRRITFRYPHLPVCPAIALGPSRCDLEKPARPWQLLNTIKQMGLLSNMLTRVYMHATRLGSARDFAHLPKSTEGFGFTTDAGRQSMGHKHASFTKGVTEAYVGGHSREIYNDVASEKRTHRREPKFGTINANEVVNAPVSNEEILQYKEDTKGVDHKRPLSEKSERKRIVKAVRRQRLEAYVQTTPMETPTLNDKVNEKANPKPTVLAPMSPSQLNVMSMPTSHRKRLKPNPPNEKQPTLPTAVIHNDIESAVGDTLIDEMDYRNIDPALLDEEFLDQLQVHKGDLETLRESIFASKPPMDDSLQGGKTMEEGTSLEGPATAAASDENGLLEESGQLLFGLESQSTFATAEQWITHHARVNIVRNRHFALKWPAYSKDGQAFEKTIGGHSVRGNSRDDPSPWVFSCSKTQGCTYMTVAMSDLNKHELLCTEALVEAARNARADTERLPCPKEGCNKTFGGKRSLAAHIHDIHDWTPKACEHGCEPLKVYQSGQTYNNHLIKKHSGRWPASCLYPACNHTLLDASLAKRHLRVAHGVQDVKKQNEYLPPLPSKERWLHQPCLVEDCDLNIILPKRSNMLRHLMSAKHSMTEAEANDLIDRRAKSETVQRTPRVIGSTRRLVKRLLEVDAEAEGVD